MAFGTLGSTLNDELNRLANGGTYRDKDDMVDEALAAKQWANRENIVPYSTDTVGILNEIAALGPNRQNWFDFNGVCNYLAGTTGLPAAAALRQITTTGDILTSLAAFYTDAATPRYNYPGYIYTNGIAGNYISTPDATALDVTGDIDIRVKVAMDDWTPAATSGLVAKWAGSTNFSYFFLVDANGTLGLLYTTDGTAGTFVSKYSTVATGIADGTAKWVRVTRSSSTGNVLFYLSDDGSTWTQLGATVTSTPSSFFSGTANLVLMANSSGGGELAAGKLYNAQIFASLNGTDKRLDVDLTTNVTSATYDQFTATTGQLCTINGQNTLTNGGSAGSLLPVTVGSSLAADSNDAKFLDHTGTNYVYLPGVAGNYISVPDANDLDITGDIDLRAYTAMDNWIPAATQYLIGKFQTTSTISYLLAIEATNGRITFGYSTDGTLGTFVSTTSDSPTGIANGAAGWVRVTRVSSTGVVKFFTSTNGTTWTQLGGDKSTTAGSMYSSTSIVELGSNRLGTSNPLAGKLLRAQILNGIDGTKVLDVDTSVITSGAATSFTAVTGQTVTINRSTSGRKTVAVTQPTWLFGTDDYMEVNNRYMAHSTSDENYVYLSGASGNYMSVSDNPPLDVTADLDLRAKISLDNWATGGSQTIVSKRTSIGNQRSYRMVVSGTGGIFLELSSDGTATTIISSTTITSFAAGATKWIRATFDSDNGAGGNTTKFFTSDDGTTWTQLGADVVNSGVFTIYSGTAAVELGSCNGGLTDRATGKIYRGQILSGINGTTVLDANAAVIALPSQTTFTDSSSNAYTVTINKSGVGTFVSTGNYLYLPGVASNFASAPDAAALDITGDIDLRVKVAMDDWTPSSNQSLICKSSGSSNISYRFFLRSDGLLQLNWSADGTAAGIAGIASTAVTGVADGATKWVRVTFDVDNGAAGKTATFFTSNDGLTWTQLGTAVTSAGTTSIFSGTASQEVGSRDSGTGELARGKFFRAQVYNGIGGTLAFDANFENSITSLLQTTFTESSSNAATVTINRSGSTFRSAGVIDAGYLYPGATNTFANSTTNFLDFGATDSFTALIVSRQANYTATQFLMSKTFGLTTPGYFLRNATGTPAALAAGFNDATVQVGLPGGSRANLELVTASSVRNTSTDTGVAYKNATAGTTITDTTTGSLANVITLQVGRVGDGGSYADMELYAAAVFRQALTATQIRQISNYFANREAYL